MHKKIKHIFSFFPLIIYILYILPNLCWTCSIFFLLDIHQQINSFTGRLSLFREKKIQVQFLFLYSDYSMYVLNYSCSFGIQRAESILSSQRAALVGWLHFRMVCEQEFLVPRRSFNALKILSFTTLRNFVFVSRKKRLDQKSDVKQSNQIKYRYVDVFGWQFSCKFLKSGDFTQCLYRYLH